MTFVDLCDAITIDSNGIEVYGDNYINKKPAMGTKLNIPAMLTQKQVKKPARKSMEDFEAKLNKICNESDSTHVSYDEKRKEWAFIVKHFTTYGLVDSDDDEEEDV